MLSTYNTLKSNRLNTKILLIIALILITLIFLVLFSIFNQPSYVKILNQSKNYVVQFHSSPTFTKFMNDINRTTFTSNNNLTSIKKIIITVEEKKIKQENDNIQVIPIRFKIDYNKSTADNLSLILEIDNEKTRNFNNDQLNYLLQDLFIALIYTRANISDSPINRQLQINNYVKEFRATKNMPLLIKYKNN